MDDEAARSFRGLCLGPEPSAELQLATLRAAIRECRQAILDDERYHYPTANVSVNAPLALEQQAMEARMDLLNKLGEIVGLERSPVRSRGRRQGRPAP